MDKNNVLSYTFTFDEIFKSYNEYKDFTSKFDLYDSSDTIAEKLNRYIYNLIGSRFWAVDINYLTKEEFKGELAVILTEEFEFFLEQRKLITSYYKLTQDDLTILQSSIASHNENPERNLTSPFTWAGYVNFQDASQQKGSVFDGYLKKLDNLPQLKTKRLLKRFAQLFSQIYVPKNYRF